MKQIFCTMWIVLGSLYVMGQHPHPVHWTFRAEKVGDKVYKVHLTANILDGWHIYAQLQPPSAISLPTKVSFTSNPLIVVVGSVEEVGEKETQDVKEVGAVQMMYKGKVDFVQVIRLKALVKTSIAGYVTFQVCTDEMCLPPETIAFKVGLE